jgi:manganese transport protein
VVEDVLPGEAAVAEAARRSLDGHSRGARRVWPFLGPAFIAVVASFASFAFEPIDAAPSGGEIAKHLVVPGFAGTESILLATGIIGATVMPHVVYLHSALTQRRIVGRDEEEKKRIVGFEKVDVVIALSLAGMVNLSMVIAAALFHESGLTGIDSIEGAYDGLKSLVSANAATVFGIALLASGFASSSVGTMAGQVVMQASSAAASRSSCAARSPWRRRWSCSASVSTRPTPSSPARSCSPSASPSRSCRC